MDQYDELTVILQTTDHYGNNILFSFLIRNYIYIYMGKIIMQNVLYLVYNTKE